MSAAKVKVSKMLEGGLDISLSDIDVTENGGYSGSTEKWQLVALVGIHNELKRLNELLACPNFVGIPKTLRSIDRCVRRIPTIAKPRAKKVKT